VWEAVYEENILHLCFELECLDQRLPWHPMRCVDPLVIVRLKPTLRGHKSSQKACLLLYGMIRGCNGSSSSTFSGALYCPVNVEIWRPHHLHKLFSLIKHMKKIPGHSRTIKESEFSELQWQAGLLVTAFFLFLFLCEKFNTQYEKVHCWDSVLWNKESQLVR
jgi:hypothetical protein